MYTTRPSRSDSRCSAPVLSIVVNLVQDAAAAGSERAVVHAGRAARVGRREALLAALALLVVANHQVALHHVDLFPVVVHERLGGERTGLDLQQPRAAAALVFLVQIAGQDLLVEARRVARRHFPAALQVDLHELQVLFRRHQACSSLESSQGERHTSSARIAWWITVPSNVMKLLKSSRAAARSREAKASFIARSLSNSSCAISTALPLLTGNGSFHSSGVWITMRCKPGQVATNGTCTCR